MLRSIGLVLAQRLQRWIPEPFVFAIVLTILVAMLALTLTDAGINQVVDDWYQGFWILLEFGMQMVLMLTTGYAIALSPVVSRMIDKLSRIAKTPGTVYFLVMIVGATFSLVSWGWAVLTAVFARELAKRVPGVDYAFLVACVYLAGQPWVGGLSSSIPLLLNTDGNFLIEAGILQNTIPVSSTLGSVLNWSYLIAFFVTLPILVWFLRPHDHTVQSMEDLGDAETPIQMTVEEEAAHNALTGTTPSDRMNNAVPLQLVMSFAALWYVARHFANEGFDLDLNVMIFVFIAAGMLVHVTPMRYVVAMKRACSNVSGIIFQYPFYAGIMGIMMFTGLGVLISDWMASFATIQSLPVIAQFSGAVVNFAIPSAGGEWAVIGPAFTQAAVNMTAGMTPAEAEAFISRIAMSVAYGETSTNLLQPFFLLVILPIMGAGVRIQARDVMGYLVIPFIYVTIMTALLVTFVPL